MKSLPRCCLFFQVAEFPSSRGEMGLPALPQRLAVLSMSSVSEIKADYPCLIQQLMGVERQQRRQEGKNITGGRKETQLDLGKRHSAGSGQKALNLIRIVSELPNEKEAVYGALDKWTTWETEFPSIAAAKALRLLRKRRQWLRVIQVQNV